MSTHFKLCLEHPLVYHTNGDYVHITDVRRPEFAAKLTSEYRAGFRHVGNHDVVMVLRCGPKNVPHFAYKSGGGGGEGYLHKYVKEAVMHFYNQGRLHEYSQTCKCNHTETQVLPSGCVAKNEVRLLTNEQVDVGLLHGDTCVFAIEILNTSETQDRSIPFIEICAKDFVRDLAMTVVNYQCTACRSRAKVKAEQELYTVLKTREMEERKFRDAELVMLEEERRHIEQERIDAASIRELVVNQQRVWGYTMCVNEFGTSYKIGEVFQCEFNQTRLCKFNYLVVSNDPQLKLIEQQMFNTFRVIDPGFTKRMMSPFDSKGNSISFYVYGSIKSHIKITHIFVNKEGVGKLRFDFVHGPK